MTRLAIVADHPIHYQAALFDILSVEPDIELVVYYRNDLGLGPHFDPGFAKTIHWDISPVTTAPHIYLSKERSRLRVAAAFTTLRFWTDILSGKFDAVLFHGWARARDWFEIFLCKISNTRVLMRGDSNAKQISKRRGPFYKNRMLRALFSVVDAFVVSGQRNAEFYEYFGANRDRFYWSPFALDNRRLMESAERSQRKRLSLRNSLGLPKTDAVSSLCREASSAQATYRSNRGDIQFSGRPSRSCRPNWRRARIDALDASSEEGPRQESYSSGL